MSTSWTEGPWKAQPTYPLGDWCVHARGIPQQLAYLAASSQVDWPLEANARLIAAAPALAEALERIDHTLSAHGHVDADTELHGFVRAALASAKGEQ